ncbi:MAG: GNAT family N-acetyltransferase [Oscillospiraceae bacterium]|nr:GNAT family N-acetyltransferase [Oscillospiraceae bacterium]
MDQLMLLKPARDYLEEIFKYRSAFIAMGEPMDGTGSLYRMPDPNDWLQQVEDLSRPETTPENWVVTSQYICVRPYDNRLVGMIQLRHFLNEFLELYGGHIEFSVLPEDRGKGYATWMLKNTLRYARDLALDRVILACDANNAAAVRVIEKNGGVPLDTVVEPDYDTELRRFTITL